MDHIYIYMYTHTHIYMCVCDLFLTKVQRQIRLESIGFQHMAREQPHYQMHKKSKVNADIHPTHES